MPEGIHDRTIEDMVIMQTTLERHVLYLQIEVLPMGFQK
jgi:hypothetical protein